MKAAFFAVVALSLWTVGVLAHEGDETDWEQAARLAGQGLVVPVESVVHDALSRRPGRLLEVEFERIDGRWAYEVEILDASGRVWELYYDARTGRLLTNRRSRHE